MSLVKCMAQTHYSNRKIMSYDRNKFSYRGIIGARGIGKTYSTQNMLCNLYKQVKGIPEDPNNVDDMFLWLRLTKPAVNRMKDRFLDVKLERKYKIVVTFEGERIYFNNRHMGYVLALADMPTIKGKPWPWQRFKYVVIDEFQRERRERRTFDIVYNLRSILESTCRFTSRLKEGYDLPYVLFMGNTVDEATDLLYAFDFLPMVHDIYKLRNKHAIIEYAANSKQYDELQKINPLRVLETNEDFTFGDKSFTEKYNIMDPQRTGHRRYMGHLHLSDYITVIVWQTQNNRLYISSEDIPTSKYQNTHYTIDKKLANTNSASFHIPFYKILEKNYNSNNIYFDKRITALIYDKYRT